MEEPAFQGRSPIRALLIDDEPAIVRIVSLTLATESDFELIAVDSGTEGLQRAVPGLVDIVLMDLHLSDLDGMDLLAKLRAVVEVPIVVFSANTEREVEAAVMAAGAAAFIAKPFDPTTLTGRLRSIVSTWSRRS